MSYNLHAIDMENGMTDWMLKRSNDMAINQSGVSSGLIQGTAVYDTARNPPPETTVRQHLTDRCADHKRNLERFERMLSALPDEMLRMKMGEFQKLFYA